MPCKVSAVEIIEDGKYVGYGGSIGPTTGDGDVRIEEVDVKLDETVDAAEPATHRSAIFTNPPHDRRKGNSHPHHCSAHLSIPTLSLLLQNPSHSFAALLNPFSQGHL
jgi:hypothetical protein